MRFFSPVLALSVLLGAVLGAPTGASAQERPLVVARPALPPLPELSDREARWVRGLKRVARRTLTCIYYEGERGGEEYSDERCWEWYDRLSASNAGGVHASGQVLLESLEDPDTEVDEAHARLVSILGHSERRVAAPYLLHLLARAQDDGPRSVELATEVLASLRQLAQLDVAPVAPWTNRFDALAPSEVRATALGSWLAWYGEAKDQPYRAWRSAGFTHARAHLDDADPAMRFAAIDHLRSAHRQHHALVASIRELILSPALSPEGRRYVSRYAGRHALMSRGQIRELLAQV